jgi:S-adenosylmethionine-diacylglycerol 3-amino-3-carboxypropyl transferase
MTNQYFSNLNYSLGNEDTRLESSLVRKFSSKKILSVCGSGSRALPLLHTGVTELICVDVALQQKFLVELRIATFKYLNHEEFLRFWGYAPFKPSLDQSFREEILAKLNLSSDAFKYIEEYFQNNEWRSLLYVGNWERTFLIFSRLIRILLQDHADKIFEFENIEDQREYFENKFPWARWNFIMFVLGNRTVFNSLLYKGCFIKKNVPESHFSYYSSAYKRLFNTDLTRKSFFLQLCFLGEIKYSEGNLNEADPSIFKEIKSCINKAELSVINGELISTIKNYQNLDFVSLSDVPSYFEGEVERNFLQEIRPHLSLGGIVVIRNYLRVPDCNREGFEDISQEFSHELSLEKVQMYKIEILRKKDK